jgi:hypothetical protein
VQVEPGQSYEITINKDRTPQVSRLRGDDNEKTIDKDVIVFHNEITAGTILSSAVNGVTQDVLFDSEGLWVPGRGEIKFKKPRPEEDPFIKVWFSAEQDTDAITVKHESHWSSARMPDTEGSYIFYYHDNGSWDADGEANVTVSTSSRGQ